MDEATEDAKRDLPTALLRGVHGRCPRCGIGSLFDGFLQIRPTCPHCGQALHHHRADDAPAYLTILIAGHLLLPIVLGVEEVFAPPVWVHLLLWIPLISVVCLALLRPIKGMIVGLQWATRMHGFGSASASADA